MRAREEGRVVRTASARVHLFRIRAHPPALSGGAPNGGHPFVPLAIRRGNQVVVALWHLHGERELPVRKVIS